MCQGTDDVVSFAGKYYCSECLSCSVCQVFSCKLLDFVTSFKDSLVVPVRKHLVVSRPYQLKNGKFCCQSCAAVKVVIRGSSHFVLIYDTERLTTLRWMWRDYREEGKDYGRQVLLISHGVLHLCGLQGVFFAYNQLSYSQHQLELSGIKFIGIGSELVCLDCKPAVSAARHCPSH